MEQQWNSSRHQFSSGEEHVRELREAVIAESGRASDGYHMGKLLYLGLKKYPDAVNQIDGVSGQQETNESVLRRSIQLATALADRGVGLEDVVAVMAPHHLDLCIPVFASQFIGAAIMPLAEVITGGNLRDNLKTSEAKIVFCQQEHTSKLAPLQQELAFEIVTFDESPDFQTMQQFIDKHSSKRKTFTFRVTDFDPYKTTAWLMSTSGTTGLSKMAILTHANVAFQLAPTRQYNHVIVPPVPRSYLVLSPLQWQTAMIMYVHGIIFLSTRIQTSAKVTPDLIIELINKYRPECTVVSPTLSKLLLEWPRKGDFSCFNNWWIGGCHTPAQIFAQAQKLMGKAVGNIHGMTEIGGMTFFVNHSPENGSVGTPFLDLQYKLVDVEKNTEVELGQVGELWMKGLTVFKGYLKDPAATRETLTPDGWLRTGDLMYRDEAGFFYYVERLKLMLKCMNRRASNLDNVNHSIAPAEIESVIRQLDGVNDVVVTSVESPTGEGDLPVAAVVRTPGCDLTADLVKEHVQKNLSVMKHLRGGVVFLPQLPYTPTAKVDRREIKRLVSTTELE